MAATSKTKRRSRGGLATEPGPRRIATGRSRTYRYYTCYNRNRYGTSGCQGGRIAADVADEAVLQALHDFYADAEALLAKAIVAAQKEFGDSHADRNAELDAITAKIAATEGKIDRYHAAFENGMMDDATAGPRIKQLRDELVQLRAHHADLTDAAAHRPEPPTAGTLDALRTYLTRIVAAGTSGERKRAIEALVHEVRITEHGMIPAFRIPSSGGVSALPDDATTMTTIRTSGSRNGAVGGPDVAVSEPHLRSSGATSHDQTCQNSGRDD